MSDNEMSRETHEALLEKALREASAESVKAMDEAQAKLKDLESEKAGLDEANAALKEENAKLSASLDEAQVALKAAQDKVAELEGVIAQRDEAAKVAEIASARAEQVKGLGLFTEEYIAEKAQAWAGVSEEDWAQRLEEWTKIRPAAAQSDAASAMTGTSESLTDSAAEESHTTATQRVLGLA